MLSKYSIHLDSIKWSKILFCSDFVEWSRIVFYSDFVEWYGIVFYLDSHVNFIEWRASCSIGVLLSGLGTLPMSVLFDSMELV